MTEAIENETFVINNPDGSISLDAYHGKSREELKERCGELCMALDEWQHIAMALAEHGKEGLSPADLAKVERMIDAYKD